MSEKNIISFDYAIKFLLKNKENYDIVEGFISAVLASQGYPPVKIKAILEREINREAVDAKRSIADLIVEDTNGSKYIVEIDRSYTSLFLHKACFNGSRLIVDSISTSEDYSKISKIIHISLLYFNFGKYKSPVHHGKTIFHEIDNNKIKNVHLEDMKYREFDSYNIFPEYFVISIPLFNDVIKSEMDEWLYVMKNADVKSDFKSPYMKKVADRLNILKMTREERMDYSIDRSVSLKERDYIVSAEEKGWKKGLAEGKAEGKAEGEAEGMKKGATQKSIDVAINMLKENMDIKLIVKITGLSEKEILDLKSAE